MAASSTAQPPGVVKTLTDGKKRKRPVKKRRGKKLTVAESEAESEAQAEAEAEAEAEAARSSKRRAAVAAARPRQGPLGDFLAGEAARAPVVPAAPVADSGLDDRLTAWAYVGAGGAAAAGGLGLGWVASGALPLDGVAAGDAPAARDAPGLLDILDDVLGGCGDPGSTARSAAPSADGADIARHPAGYKRPATARA
eukprot:jgi/Tetstr1/434309/TSEL_023415.t1